MEWISVNERMPYINITPGVLVYSEIGGIDVQSVYNNGQREPIFDKGWNKGQYYEVTHWMPLPPPPSIPKKIPIRPPSDKDENGIWDSTSAPWM